MLRTDECTPPRGKQKLIDELGVRQASQALLLAAAAVLTARRARLEEVRLYSFLARVR